MQELTDDERNVTYQEIQVFRGPKPERSCATSCCEKINLIFHKKTVILAILAILYGNFKNSQSTNQTTYYPCFANGSKQCTRQARIFCETIHLIALCSLSGSTRFSNFRDGPRSFIGFDATDAALWINCHREKTQK